MNANELSRALAASADRIVAHLLPGGRKKGPEWKAGSVAGESGDSLSVRLSGPKAGVWSDFATGESGDLLDLWAACRGQSIAEAINDAKAFLGIRDAMPQREVKSYRRPARPQCRAPQTRVRAWLMARGLTEQTIEAFRIGEHERDGKAYAVFPYLRDGELINAKTRNIDEKRDMRQETGAEPCLFGWHLIDPKARSITITEGEIDAMTLHQVGIPALSVNAGAGNHQWIENDWDRLERFSEIFIAFDDDEPGRKGAREVAQRLGMERCRIVTFGAKDANQWLMDGADGEEFHHALSVAKPLDPEELASMADFFRGVTALFYPTGADTANPCLRIGDRDCDWFEFRPGEYTCWTGINGHGKSLMLSQVLLGLMQQDQRVMVFSGELTPERQGKRLVKQATGLDRPSPGYIDAVAEWVRDRMWVFNLVGTAKLDRLLDVFAYGARRYGIAHFVIDSLMMTDVPEDGPGSLSAQKEAIQKLTGFAKSTRSHIHLVAHPRKARDESQPPGKLDVGGSGRITDAADNVFSVWSARKEEGDLVDEKPDALLELQKQRNGDVQHQKLWLYFNRPAMQFCTHSRRRAVPIVPYQGQPVVAAAAAS
jgi:twinkle protein